MNWKKETTGLDPQSRHAMWDMILDMRANRKTIFLTTHFMEEAECLCDRVAIAGDVLTNFVMIMLGIMLLLVLGLTVYRIQFEGNVLSLAFALCLSSAAFLAIGNVLASVLPNNRVATLVGNLLLYPMMFFSGATVPREMLPVAIQKLSYALPLTHVVSLVKGAWFGEPLNQYWMEIVVLSAILVVGTLISTRAFRWE